MCAKQHEAEALSGGSATLDKIAAVERILDRTLEDLAFVFDHPDQLESISHDRSQVIRAVDKVAVETVLLMDTVVKSGVVMVDDQRVQKILDICAPSIRSPRNRFLFTHNPRLCTSFGLGHILLTGLGHADPAFDRVLDVASSSVAMHPSNKLPFRLLDDYWVMQRAGMRLPEKRRVELANFTMLNAPIKPLYYRTDDYYALTHEIMYLTDFGCSELPLEYDVEKALALIEVGILDNLNSYDLDVLSELVAVSAMLRPQKLGPVATVAAALLAQEFSMHGVMPSRNFDPEELKAQADPVLQRCYIFFNTYHTTHVFAMMQATLFRAEIAPLRMRKTAMPLPAALRSQLSDQNANAPTWLDRFALLEIENGGHTAILAGIALFDAVRRQDSAALFKVLNLVKSERIPLPGDLMSDIMEHLARVTICAR